MSESRDEDRVQLPQSDYTAEELLTKLLELIINSSDISEFTTAAIETTFGIRLAPYSEDAERYVARLTADWNVSLEVFDDEVYGRGVDVTFHAASQSHPPMTDICGVDSDAFAALLERAGFERRAMYGIHGERWGARYFRGQIEVTTFIRGEASEPHEKIAHSCIRSVEIRQRE